MSNGVTLINGKALDAVAEPLKPRHHLRFTVAMHGDATAFFRTVLAEGAKYEQATRLQEPREPVEVAVHVGFGGQEVEDRPVVPYVEGRGCVEGGRIALIHCTVVPFVPKRSCAFCNAAPLMSSTVTSVKPRSSK